MAAIRTVTVTMTSIFRGLVTELIAGHGNLDLVGTIDSRDRLEEQLQLLSPDLILVGLGRNEGDEVGLSLVRLLPNARVIALSSDGRDAFVYQMRAQRMALRNVSAQSLIDITLSP